MLKKTIWSGIMLLIISVNLLAQHKKIEKGVASYYHDHLRLHRTANGEQYHPHELTAAHLTLPFNTLVRVLNLKNNKSVTVRINDRGPFINNRIIDLSKAAADSLDFLYEGLTRVELKVINIGKHKINPKPALLAKRTASLPKTLSKATLVNAKKNLKPKEKNKLKNTDTLLVNPKPPIAELIPVNADTNIIRGRNIVYGVQIGSFKQKSNMLNLSERLKNNFIEEFNIQEITKNNELYYRMILGEYATEAQAEKLRKKVTKEFPNCFIIKYEN